jgi:hypothetical protein
MDTEVRAKNSNRRKIFCTETGSGEQEKNAWHSTKESHDRWLSKIEARSSTTKNEEELPTLDVTRMIFQLNSNMIISEPWRSLLSLPHLTIGMKHRNYLWHTSTPGMRNKNRK